MQLLRLLQLLLLPAVVDAFGGLNYVSTNTGTSNGAPTVVLPPGDMKTDFGWDQTANDPLAASAIIGNTRINVWKWQTPPAPPPPAQPSRCCDVYPLYKFRCHRCGRAGAVLRSP